MPLLGIHKMRLVSVGVVLLVAACASTAVRPGTGHLTFRLTWTGSADLDLYAQSPLGERVHFLHRKVDSGGTLDIDCNVGEFLCPDPMENIFWPRGGAPAGIYKYWVVIANADGLQPSDTYHLRVLALGELVTEHGGSITDLQQQPLSARIQID